MKLSAKFPSRFLTQQGTRSLGGQGCLGKWLCPLTSARGRFPKYFGFLGKAPWPGHEPERWQTAEARTEDRGVRPGRDRGRARPWGWQDRAALRNPQLRLTRGTREESENTPGLEVPSAVPPSGLRNWPRRAQTPGSVPLSRKAWPGPQSVRAGQPRGDTARRLASPAGTRVHLSRSRGRAGVTARTPGPRPSSTAPNRC